jgi:hypothetical protein
MSNLSPEQLKVFYALAASCDGYVAPKLDALIGELALRGVLVNVAPAVEGGLRFVVRLPEDCGSCDFRCDGGFLLFHGKLPGSKLRRCDLAGANGIVSALAFVQKVRKEAAIDNVLLAKMEAAESQRLAERAENDFAMARALGVGKGCLVKVKIAGVQARGNLSDWLEVRDAVDFSICLNGPRAEAFFGALRAAGLLEVEVNAEEKAG